jgi:tripartite-type tricarboxylate transporter receptor subunit TctC
MKNKLTRRAILQSVAGAGLAAGFSLPTSAQQQKTIRLNVGFAAGGPADSIARLVALLMNDSATTVIVDNKPGATGQLAADAVKRSAQDGSNLLVTPSSVLSLVPHLYKKPMYNSLEDFVPVGCICDHSFALAVPASSPIKSVADYIEAAKARPNDATYATAGAGSGMHFLGTLFAQETGLKLTHVPYKGAAPGLQDLMAGQVFSSFNPLPTMLELHRGEKIRILAVSNPTRVTSLPNVPTFTELKMPALELVEWYGVFAARTTSPGTLQALVDQLNKALKKPEMAVSARKLELEPRLVEPNALKKMLVADYEKWAGIVKSTGITLDS